MVQEQEINLYDVRERRLAFLQKNLSKLREKQEQGEQIDEEFLKEALREVEFIKEQRGSDIVHTNNIRIGFFSW